MRCYNGTSAFRQCGKLCFYLRVELLDLCNIVSAVLIERSSICRCSFGQCRCNVVNIDNGVLQTQPAVWIELSVIVMSVFIFPVFIFLVSICIVFSIAVFGITVLNVVFFLSFSMFLVLIMMFLIIMMLLFHGDKLKTIG